MSLLVACPVIMPPRADVVASWNYRPHYLMVNGATEEWSKVVAASAERPINGIWNLKNVGVAVAWNQAFHQAIARGFSHVALLSQGTVLEGGTERLADLVDEYADHRGLLTDFAWHCIVLSTNVWRDVGPFDERFYPAYYEDSDYVRRLYLAGLHTPDNRIPKVGRDLLDGTETQGAALLAGLIPESAYGFNALRYRHKWGGDPFRETYQIPDDPTSFEGNTNWGSAESARQGGNSNDHSS